MFQIRWKKPRRVVLLPELNVFPSDTFALSGYFPATQLIKANRMSFTISQISVGELDYDVVTPPTIPGLEYTLPANRFHYTLPEEDN